MKTVLTLAICLYYGLTIGQTNIKTLKIISSEIMRGDYDPSVYQASTIVDDPHIIAERINAEVSPDSLKSYLAALQVFETRNSGSDTISNSRGIGAARRWIYDKFQSFSSQRENRLVVDYLQFERPICGMNQHRNVLATLPGVDPDAGIIIIEGHMDSRCEGNCDIDCLAEGMEDNGSGTGLVIELARVMSQFTFKRTIVFMTTTAEEQGLFGADAMARHMRAINADVKAVLNNDVIGGIVCGETSSPPSCPGFNHIDSTQVRLFSFGGTNSPHKALARYCKLQYEEELKDKVKVPMQITIMSAEDRTGRGGDHIPFREQGYPAMRFTSANEHGDAGVGPDYHDRQHSVRDILGVDTDNDGELDSFYVDFNYLSRNAVINGLTAAMVSVSPEIPQISAEQRGNRVQIDITDDFDYNKYRIGVRSFNTDFDTLITIEDSKTYDFPLTGDETFLFFSVAAVDDKDIESCFSTEKTVIVEVSGAEDVILEKKPVTLLQNRPNPFDEATIISWSVDKEIDHSEAFIVITDLNGKEITRNPATLDIGMNEWVFTYGYLFEGVYNYSLLIDGVIVDSKRMIFAY